MRLTTKMLAGQRAQIAPAMKAARNIPIPDFSREAEKTRDPMPIPHPPKPIKISFTFPSMALNSDD